MSHNNTVPRVRPISHKEQRNRDEGIIQFPGEGQIWVGGVQLSDTFDTLTLLLLRWMKPREL